MRHNAKLSFTYHETEGAQRFTIYLTGYGKPEEVKSACIRALRNNRTLIATDPDTAVFNISFHLRKKTQVNLTPQAPLYLWHYAFNLSAVPPRVTIKNPSNGISETLAFFPWLGDSRRQRRVLYETKLRIPGQHRRGKPSHLRTDPRIARIEMTPPPGGWGNYLPPEDKQSTPLPLPKARKKVRIS